MQAGSSRGGFVAGEIPSACMEVEADPGAEQLAPNQRMPTPEAFLFLFRKCDEALLISRHGCEDKQMKYDINQLEGEVGAFPPGLQGPEESRL